MALGILLAWGPRASGSDSALDVSQYPHPALKVREGFPKSTISSIAQTPDGCLWLGGLLRFDCVWNVPWHPPVGEPPSVFSRILRAACDGSLGLAPMKGLLVGGAAGSLSTPS